MKIKKARVIDMERQVVEELQKVREERLTLERAVMQICGSSRHPEWLGLTLIKNYHLIEAINKLVRLSLIHI